DHRRHSQDPGVRRRREARGASPRHPARDRAVRGPVRLAHAGHEVLGHARPDGGHRPARDHLARRRPARHQHVPHRRLRRAHAPDGAPAAGAR
ncbi:MAG: Aromatic-amino-acid aminotransferase, partial [uncultured Solirubrobacteraceae bacterium]